MQIGRYCTKLRCHAAQAIGRESHFIDFVGDSGYFAPFRATKISET
jgi:hypothetical protein